MRYAFAAVLLAGCSGTNPNPFTPGNVTFKDLGPGPCEIGAHFVVDSGVTGYSALIQPLYTFDEKGRAATVAFRGVGQPPWELSYASSEPCNVPPPILDEYEAPDSPSFVHGCPSQLTPDPSTPDELVKLTHDGEGHRLSLEIVPRDAVFKLSGEWTWGADGALTGHTGRIGSLESWEVAYTQHDGGYRGAGLYTCQVPRCSQASTTFHDDLETDALGRLTRLTREIAPIGTLGPIDVVYRYDCGPACSSDADCPPGPDWSCAPASIWGKQCTCTPTGREVCDGHDNDCDGVIDEDPMDCLDVTGHVCTNGVCTCPAMCGGSCVDLKRDINNCGQCNHACPSGQVCNDSQCGCGSTRQYCNGACIDVSMDPQNCGACGATCTGGTCSGSQCHCATGMPCAGKCTDTTSDSSNCGGCGVACGTAETCVGSHCQCTGAMCGGACKDIANDKQNCGGCGVACSGTCGFGHCIQTLATNQSDPRGIGVDATSVYWANYTDGTVRATSLSGGGGISTVATAGSPYGLAVAGGSVYWADYSANGKIMRAMPALMVSGVFASGQAYPEEVVADSAGVYWTLTNSVQSGSTPNTVASVPNVRQLALDAANVYFTAQNGVFAAPRDGGSYVTLASGTTTTAIAVNATTVFWVNATAFPTLMRAPLDGGMKTTVSTQPGDVSFMLADNAYLYWLTSNSIMEAPLDGGAAVQISPVGGWHMAMDATHLYWTSGLGTVSRTTKP